MNSEDEGVFSVLDDIRNFDIENEEIEYFSDDDELFKETEESAAAEMKTPRSDKNNDEKSSSTDDDESVASPRFQRTVLVTDSPMTEPVRGAMQACSLHSPRRVRGASTGHRRVVRAETRSPNTIAIHDEELRRTAEFYRNYVSSGESSADENSTDRVEEIAEPGFEELMERMDNIQEPVVPQIEEEEQLAEVRTPERTHLRLVPPSPMFIVPQQQPPRQWPQQVIATEVPNYVSNVTFRVPLGVQDNTVPTNLHRQNARKGKYHHRTRNSRCKFGVWTRVERTDEQNRTKARQIRDAESVGDIVKADYVRSIRGPPPVINEPPYVHMSDSRWNTRRFYNADHPDPRSTVRYEPFPPLQDQFRLRRTIFDEILRLRSMHSVSEWSRLNQREKPGIIPITGAEVFQGTGDSFMVRLIQLASGQDRGGLVGGIGLAWPGCTTFELLQAFQEIAVANPLLLHRNVAIHVGICDVENRSDMSVLAQHYHQIANVLCRIGHIERIVFFSVPWCVKHSRGDALGHVTYRPRAINNFLRNIHQDAERFAPGAASKIKFFDYSPMFTAHDGRTRRPVRLFFESFVGRMENIDLIHLAPEANRDLLDQFRQFCRHEYGWA